MRLKSELYEKEQIQIMNKVIQIKSNILEYEKGELKMYNVTIIKGSFFDIRILVVVRLLRTIAETYFNDREIPFPNLLRSVGLKL